MEIFFGHYRLPFHGVARLGAQPVLCLTLNWWSSGALVKREAVFFGS